MSHNDIVAFIKFNINAMALLNAMASIECKACSDFIIITVFTAKCNIIGKYVQIAFELKLKLKLN